MGLVRAQRRRIGRVASAIEDAPRAFQGEAPIVVRPFPHRATDRGARTVLRVRGGVVLPVRRCAGRYRRASPRRFHAACGSLSGALPGNAAAHRGRRRAACRRSREDPSQQSVLFRLVCRLTEANSSTRLRRLADQQHAPARYQSGAPGFQLLAPLIFGRPRMTTVEEYPIPIGRVTLSFAKPVGRSGRPDR